MKKVITTCKCGFQTEDDYQTAGDAGERIFYIIKSQVEKGDKFVCRNCKTTNTTTAFVENVQ